MPGFDQTVDQDFRNRAIRGASAAVLPITGSFTLRPEHNGICWLSELDTNVTITVPGDLFRQFNSAFATFGTGWITIDVTGGAVNRSTVAALNAQYKQGGLLIWRNSGGNTAEFLLGGDFA